MPNAQIPTGQYAQFPFQGTDANGNPAVIHGTVSIDNYTNAYVALNGLVCQVVPKVVPPAGSKYTVNVTIAGTDSSGNALTPVILPFDVDGNVTITVGAIVNANIGFSTLPDPGSASVSF